MTVIYGHRHGLDFFFFTTPVSKAKYFSTIWHVSSPVVAQEEKEHFMVECVSHFINSIVYKEAPLYCVEVFKKTFWNFSE